MKSQVLLTVWCHISCEAAGEFWHWSLSGVKGLNVKTWPRNSILSLDTAQCIYLKIKETELALGSLSRLSPSFTWPWWRSLNGSEVARCSSLMRYHPFIVQLVVSDFFSLHKRRTKKRRNQQQRPQPRYGLSTVDTPMDSLLVDLFLSSFLCLLFLTVFVSQNELKVQNPEAGRQDGEGRERQERDVSQQRQFRQPEENERYLKGTLTLSLSRVINFKFPPQPHQKYNITQYEKLGFW